MAHTSVEAFLLAHKDFEQLPTGKIRCRTTGHECKADLTLLIEHIQGRKYKVTAKRQEQAAAPLDFSQYEFVTEHKKMPDKAYCRLTKLELNKNAQEIGVSFD
jgi:hypothetical protein